MAMAIDGLISGMSTTDMISQLMKVEAMPQGILKNKVTAQGKAMSAYQGINTRMSSLLTAARALGTADVWGAMKATASSDAVTVRAKPSASAGSISFTVDRLAAAHTVTFGGRVTSTTDATGSPVMSGTTFDILLADGTSTTVTPADKSLSTVVSAINNTANAAYTAATVQVAPGEYTLQLTAKKTGAAGTFTAPAGIDLLGTAAVTTQAADAQLTVGTTSTYTITSTNNTFTDVLPGLTVTATKTQTASPVTVTVASDTDSIATKVQALVDSVNVVLNDITSQTRTKNGTVAAGPLVGDAAMRKISQDILSAVSGGAGSLGSLSQVGITLTREGTLAFDKQKFLDALAADPAKARSFLDSYTNVSHANAKAGAFDPGWDTATGLARKLETLAANASEGIILPTDPTTKAREGLLTTLINRRNDQIDTLNDQVTAWDRRLEMRKTALERQWSQLEVVLGKLQSQQSWLAGQLAGLPTYSS